MKRCRRCKAFKSPENFGKLKSARDGLYFNCRQCVKEVNLVTYDKKVEWMRQRYATDSNYRSLIVERNKTARHRNLDKLRTAWPKYRAKYTAKLKTEDPAKLQQQVRQRSQRRRARKAKCLATLTEQEWKQIKVTFNYHCAYCHSPTKLEQEHMRPISRGGDHSAANVIPACRSCNARKHTRTLLEFVNSA